MKRCEICEAGEYTNDPERPKVKLVTIKERVCCESCILLGMDSLRHWNGELEKDNSEEISIGGHTLCESHIIMGIDSLKSDLEAFLSRIPKDNRA